MRRAGDIDQNELRKMRLEMSEDASPDKAAARVPPTPKSRRRFRSEAVQARTRAHALAQTLTYVRMRQARATQMNCRVSVRECM